jgi:hypothetical protein
LRGCYPPAREAPLQHIIKTLVRTPSCKIDRCSCGAVHISVGSTTVRLVEGAARELSEALARAMVAIDGRQSAGREPGLYLADTSGNGDDGPQFH